jgi:ATP-dependent exoDNAse (exonuclease V) beta subunit
MKTTIDSPEVKVVDASAGSGKTYTLARRYIQLLLEKDTPPEAIKTILAITFTNMATKEMKERILEFLKKLALDFFEDRDERARIYSSIGWDEKYVRHRAGEILNYIIKNYNFFQIQTIDSFINLLLSGCAFRLGLPANFKIQENFRQLLLYSLDECIEAAERDKKIHQIFQEFLRQYIHIENKESWFPKRDILHLIYSLFNQLNIYGKNFKKFPHQVEYIFELKKEIKNLIGEFIAKYNQVVHGTFLNTIRAVCEVEGEGFDLSILTGKNYKKKAFIYDSPPLKKNAKYDPDGIREWQKIREKISELAEAEAQAVFNCYIDIFELVYQIFESRAKKEEFIFLAELNRKARSLFGQEYLIPEIYYQLALRFRHFLIDEFQDTSRLQWENLFLMIEDALASGGTLFYVGDKKQAIYRWRGGEVTLFEEIKSKFRDFNVKEEQLNINYRSQKAIVDFNNMVFSPRNLNRFLCEEFGDQNNLKYFSHQDREEIVSIFKSSTQESKEGNVHGYVRVEEIEGNDKEEREEKIKTKLKALILDLKSRNFDYRDIAILCRTHDEVQTVTAWLMEEGLGVQSDKTLDIRNNPVVKELVSCLKFLSSPIDNLSFTSFILGEVFQTATGINRKQLEEFLLQWNLSINKGGSEYIYRNFRVRYPDAWNEYLDELFKSVGFLNIYELTLKIITTFKVFQNFPNYQGFVMHLLELMKEKEEEYPDLEEFLEFYENTEEEIFYFRYPESNAVRIMTIHKAKGLEFPVVILPFLDIDIQPGRGQERKDFSYLVFPHAESLHLLRLDKKYVILSRRIREIYRREYKQTFIDELDVVYVALTRAQYELYVFLPYGGRKKNILLNLIPENSREIGEKRVYHREQKQSEDIKFINPCEYKSLSEFLAQEGICGDVLKAREEIKRGNILHYILSFISDFSVEDEKDILDQALNMVRFQYRNVPVEEYGNQVKEIFKNENFRKFFYVNGAEVYCEKEVVDAQGMTRKIDRLIVTGSEVWVVDYKTGEPLPDYTEQVREYIEIVKAIYPDHKVKGYLLYLDKGTVEEVNE